MRIIITGATGSLGAFLTRYYSKKGHDVIACGRDERPHPNLLNYATYLKKDISKPFLFPEADICIHTAALSDDKATANQLYKPNVLGTKYTAEASIACKKFIQISSSSVYLPSKKPITEEMAGKQNNKLLSPYGMSKLMAEEMLMETTKHNSCFILRPRAFYGAGDKVILPRILKLVKNGIFNRPGKMQISVSLTHYENIAKAIDVCIDSSKKGIHIYNVADEETYIFVDVIRKIIKEMYADKVKEKEIGIWILKLLAAFKINGITPLLVRSFTQDMVLDISKIKSELNYRTAVNFDSKLPELSEWVKNIGGVEALKTGNRDYAWSI
ncbi:MAG: NAD(P)-dependent oxidoreductase [Bacteroidia bacterium]